MKLLTNATRREAPPLWVTLGAALVLAAALLSVFVDTLHDNLRRGAELHRLQAQAGSSRQVVNSVVEVANAVPPRVEAAAR